MKKRFLRSLQLMTCLLFVFQCYTVYGSQDQPFLAGSQLPQFILAAPDSQQTLSYLGLRSRDPYTISQIGAKLVLIEFLNALCPHCHANAPILNRFYNVVQKDAALAKDVKIIGICIGNSKTETDAYKKSYKVPFPVIPDEESDILNAVQVSVTPTLVLVSSNGKVLTSHSGVIRDFDGLLKELREIHKKQ
jgi:thiol-disulfide isomerase/thioredoxin